MNDYLKLKTIAYKTTAKWLEGATFFIFPFFLLLLFLFLIVLSVATKSYISVNAIPDVSFILPSAAPYPNVKNEAVTISAKSAIVVDDDSKVVLYAKNENTRFSMASTTKIMTALIALDYFKPDDIIVVKTDDVGGTVLGVTKNEKFYFQDLLHAMLLPSANDAAYAIAENYPGGEKAFVKKMNEKANELHLYNVHYDEPTGLSDDQNFATAADLATLASVAMRNTTFAQIVNTKNKEINDLSGRNFSLISLNKLLGIDGVNGVKTGYTLIAGGVLVTSQVKNNHTYIIVVMQSVDRFADTEMLLSQITHDVEYQVLTP